MRITGLATGMDIDAIVETTMQAYRTKIDTAQQNKEILEIKQKLYRDVIEDSREFYNKYFDVSKTDSLLLSGNWSTTSFTSSDESVVSVKGSVDAVAGNYTITGNSATAAQAVVDGDINEITINGKKFTISGSNGKSKAENLNKELKEAGINVQVKYSDFAGSEAGNKSGFIFESTTTGKNSSFTLGGDITTIGTANDGKNATATKITGLTIADIKNNGGKINIDGEEIDLELTDKMTDEDITKALNSKLSKTEHKMSAEIDKDGNITFASSKVGAESDLPNISIGDKVGTETKGTDATVATLKVEKSDIQDGKVSINGTMIDLSKAKDGQVEEYINTILTEEGKNITAKVSEDGSITFTANKAGDQSIEMKKISGSAAVSEGTDANIIIKDSKGGVYTHTGSSNKVTLDGVTFDFKGEIPKDGIKITGENNVEDIKDDLVTFINDYNTLIEKLNTMTSTKNDRSYKPLTEAQKKEMTEEEIKLWNAKVEAGQLYKDSDINRITNSLKESMRSFMDGANLEKFGIKPVADYQGSKNGTFTIDETKLTEALQNNPEEVRKLFVDGSDDGKQKGILNQLKDTLYKETVTTSSLLIKKAGIEGSATMSNNELTKEIEKYTRTMKDLESSFATREQALYSQWATVETMMNQLNSQQSSLASMFQ